MGKSRRPTKAQIYRRRRIVVAILLIIFLSLSCFCVYSLGVGVRAVSAVISNSYERPSIIRTAVPDAPKHSQVQACAASDISLTLKTDTNTASWGGSVNFTATVAYTKKSSCLLDVSNATRVLTITSGDETIWRSDVCPADQRKLLFAQGDTDSQTITWDTNRTTDTCVDNSELSHVSTGTYVAQLSLKDYPKVVSNKEVIVIG
ncbi:MAG: hypothetical protein Q3961_01825 [Bifidobacteriaceae bacterium]|nr:hypothetical protein [Bifidobacteriaceae bacterium]